MKKVLITEPDRLAHTLNEVLDYLRDVGFGEPSYGYFHGGDPRTFTPDAESCTDDEMDKWKADCKKWDDGDRTPTPSPHTANTEPISLPNKKGEIVTYAPGSIMLTRSFYGVGTNLDVKEQAMREDLEDLLLQCRRAAREK